MSEPEHHVETASPNGELPPPGLPSPWPPAPHSPPVVWVYPYPEILADWRWMMDEMNSGRLDQYGGHFVAVCDKQVVGHDSSETRLRRSVAETRHLDPDRLLICYIEG